MFHNAKSKNKGRREHMAEDASIENCIPPEELKERFKEAKRFTSGVVFGVGDVYPGPAVWDDVICCNKA